MLDICDVCVNYLIKLNRLYLFYCLFDCVFRVVIMVEFIVVVDEDKFYVGVLRLMGVGEVKLEMEWFFVDFGFVFIICVL